MAPSWPIVLTGSYADGSLCKASDYRSDFETLRDAVNQLFERFSSFEFNALAVSADLASGADTSVGSTEVTTHNFHRTGATDRTVVKVFRIPTWMQGVRIRQFEVTNCSRFPTIPGNYGGGSDVFRGTITVELSVADDPSKFDKDSGDWTATTISEVSFIGGGTAGGTDNEVFGTTEASDSETAIKRNELAYTVQPNNYLAVSIKGSMEHGPLDFDDDPSPSAPLWMFQITTLCDTMVPIP